MTRTWDEVMLRFGCIAFLDAFDTIVAIANGGVIPAALLQQRLDLPLFLLKLNYRNADQQPIYAEPKLLEPLTFNPRGRRILLVEDRVKTGASLACAVRLLSDATLVKTFAVNGKADYYLYNEECFTFPWKLWLRKN
jgi:xanthine phosphoribosyltransferase